MENRIVVDEEKYISYLMDSIELGTIVDALGQL